MIIFVVFFWILFAAVVYILILRRRLNLYKKKIDGQSTAIGLFRRKILDTDYDPVTGYGTKTCPSCGRENDYNLDGSTCDEIGPRHGITLFSSKHMPPGEGLLFDSLQVARPIDIVKMINTEDKMSPLIKRMYNRSFVKEVRKW